MLNLTFEYYFTVKFIHLKYIKQGMINNKYDIDLLSFGGHSLGYWYLSTVLIQWPVFSMHPQRLLLLPKGQHLQVLKLNSKLSHSSLSVGWLSSGCSMSRSRNIKLWRSLFHLLNRIRGKFETRSRHF